jgi:CubicO group peptidase (beta-lactamase class C family)
LHRFAQLYAPEGVNPTGFGERPTGKRLVVAADFLSNGYINGQQLESGGIGLVGTARDYLRFAQMLLNGGELAGVRILSPKTVRYMTTNHLGDLAMGLGRKGTGFGLGFAVVEDPAIAGTVGSVGEYSWGGAAGTTFWVDPVENLVGIFMVQSLPHLTNLKDQFKRLTYGAMTESYQ